LFIFVRLSSPHLVYLINEVLKDKRHKRVTTLFIRDF